MEARQKGRRESGIIFYLFQPHILIRIIDGIRPRFDPVLQGDTSVQLNPPVDLVLVAVGPLLKQHTARQNGGASKIQWAVLTDYRGLLYSAQT